MSIYFATTSSLVTSATRSPPATPTIRAKSRGRQIPIASVKVVFHAFHCSVLLVVVDIFIIPYPCPQVAKAKVMVASAVANSGGWQWLTMD